MHFHSRNLQQSLHYQKEKCLKTGEYKDLIAQASETSSTEYKALPKIESRQGGTFELKKSHSFY